jgi:hypothetical protein
MRVVITGVCNDYERDQKLISSMAELVYRGPGEAAGDRRTTDESSSRL